MNLQSEFDYVWDLTRSGVHAALLKKVKSGEIISPEHANQALKVEKLWWKDETRAQYAFMEKLRRERPQQAKAFWHTFETFVFRDGTQTAAPNTAVYLTGVVLAALIGLLFGWFMPAGWILPKMIGRVMTVVVAVLVIGGMGASLCLGFLKSKQEEQKKKQLDFYMNQLEELRKKLSGLCE